MRKPVIVSSKTSAAPISRVTARSVAQELARLQIGTAALHRLDQDRGQLAGVRADQVERLGAPVVEDEQVLGNRRRDADHRRDRRAVPEPRAHGEHAVRVPVVRAGEQRDLAAAGLRAREPQRRHDRLGAGVREGDALHARRRRNQFGHLAGEVRLRAEMEAVGELTLERGHHEGRLVPEEIHAEAHRDVDVLVAVDVPHARAARALGDDGIEHLLEGELEADRRAVVGQMTAVSGRQRLRPLRARLELRDQLAQMLCLLRRQGVAP